MSDYQPRLVLTPEDIERILRRMAYQIWENSAGRNLALVGIRKRGDTLAKRLKPLLDQISGGDTPLGILDIALYRDDIGLNPVAPEVRSTEIPFDIQDKDIVLIDDVLFTGRTIRSALNALMDLGRPNRVHLLVLVDRGHRELPIQADYVGKELKTYANERVTVYLREEDGKDGVFLELPER
jgi:pyrimidine operon attenuation protein/uracil phosphoribosyltransferase